MKLTADFDPDFVAMPRPKCRRLRIWRLVIIVPLPWPRSRWHSRMRIQRLARR